MERADWALVVIDAAKPKSLEPVHLQKILFLLDKNLKPKHLKVDRFYRFRPYDYGPFCSDIYGDVEALAESGLVQATPAQWRR